MKCEWPQSYTGHLLNAGCRALLNILQCMLMHFPAESMRDSSLLQFILWGRASKYCSHIDLTVSSNNMGLLVFWVLVNADIAE
jgi:hypothetical protein